MGTRLPRGEGEVAQRGLAPRRLARRRELEAARCVLAPWPARLVWRFVAVLPVAGLTAGGNETPLRRPRSVAQSPRESSRRGRDQRSRWRGGGKGLPPLLPEVVTADDDDVGVHVVLGVGVILDAAEAEADAIAA